MSQDDEKPKRVRKKRKAAETKVEEAQAPKEKVDESLPILPLRNAVLFPSALMPIVVGRPRTLRLIKHAEANGGIVGVLSQKDKETEDPGYAEFHDYGTAARILKIM